MAPLPVKVYTRVDLPPVDYQQLQNRRLFAEKRRRQSQSSCLNEQLLNYIMGLAETNSRDGQPDGTSFSLCSRFGGGA